MAANNNVHDSQQVYGPAERKLDELLLQSNLSRKKVPKDGACLFRCISEQVYGSQVYHSRLRAQCVRYMRAHENQFSPFLAGCSELPWDHYLFELQKDETWGGYLELLALSTMLRVNFSVHTENPVPTVVDQGYPATIRLAFSGGNHYDIILSDKASHAHTFSQALVYSLTQAVITSRAPSAAATTTTTANPTDNSNINSVNNGYNNSINNSYNDTDTSTHAAFNVVNSNGFYYTVNDDSHNNSGIDNNVINGNNSSSSSNSNNSNGLAITETPFKNIAYECWMEELKKLEQRDATITKKLADPQRDFTKLSGYHNRNDPPSPKPTAAPHNKNARKKKNQHRNQPNNTTIGNGDHNNSNNTNHSNNSDEDSYIVCGDEDDTGNNKRNNSSNRKPKAKPKWAMPNAVVVSPVDQATDQILSAEELEMKEILAQIEAVERKEVSQISFKHNFPSLKPSKKQQQEPQPPQKQKQKQKQSPQQPTGNNNNNNSSSSNGVTSPAAKVVPNAPTVTTATTAATTPAAATATTTAAVPVAAATTTTTTVEAPKPAAWKTPKAWSSSENKPT